LSTGLVAALTVFLVLLIPVGPAGAAIPACVFGTTMTVLTGLLIGSRRVLVDGDPVPRTYFEVGIVRRFTVLLRDLDLRGVQISRRGVMLGRLVLPGEVVSGHLMLYYAGEPARASLALPRRMPITGWTPLLGAAVAVPLVEDAWAVGLVVLLSLLRCWLSASLVPSLRSSSVDPRATCRDDVLHSAVELGATVLTVLAVVLTVDSPVLAALATALLAAGMNDVGPSLSVLPPLLLLAVRGVWILPPVGTLERDRAAGLLRRAGAAYEFRHEELRLALLNGQLGRAESSAR
jgi:hypothetical protein